VPLVHDGATVGALCADTLQRHPLLKVRAFSCRRRAPPPATAPGCKCLDP
jgi:hypothetical protein